MLPVVWKKKIAVASCAIHSWMGSVYLQMVMEPAACCSQGQDDGWSTYCVQVQRMAEVHFRVVKMLIWGS